MAWRVCQLLMMAWEEGFGEGFSSKCCSSVRRWRALAWSGLDVS